MIGQPGNLVVSRRTTMQDVGKFVQSVDFLFFKFSKITVPLSKDRMISITQGIHKIHQITRKH